MSIVCPQLREHGSCSDPLCPYSHAVLTCDPCGFMCVSAIEMAEHNQSRIHLNKIQGQSLVFRCPLCRNKILHGRAGWNFHITNRTHINRAHATGLDPRNVVPEEMDIVPKHTFCVICNVHIQDVVWDRHLTTPRHLEKEQFAAFRVVLDDAEKDKNGVTLVGDFNFGIVALAEASAGKIVKGTISSSIPTGRFTLVGIRLLSTKGTLPSHSSFKVSGIKPGCQIISGRPVVFNVIFCQNHAGQSQDRLELVLEDGRLRTRFLISRGLLSVVGNKADYEKLKPTAPYVPRTRTKRQPEMTVVEGVMPPTLRAIPYVVILLQAPIPMPLLSTLSNGSPAQIENRIKTVFLPSTFNIQTYGRQFKQLLWMEEYRAERDLEIYDMTNVTMAVHAPYYYLTVPGLAEKRPSVLVGDHILVQKQGAPEGEWFEGGVHFVRKEEVGLRFNKSFAGWTTQQRYNVRFKLNRFPIRRQHQALDTAFSEERILFPKAIIPKSGYPKQVDARLRVQNPLIAGNLPQLQAVVSIVKRPPGSVPFIIFGPPGTGKTVTIVEAIRQVLLANPNAKILACAPSNSAADIIASRLLDLGPDVLFRFYAPSRFKDQVPLELMPYTHVRPDGHFTVAPMSRMMRFRVIVTTCVSASVVSGIGMPRGHFSHIFVDEAGQATEPEVAISFMTMADTNTNVVLSGDPKQLGPIIRSILAAKLGLEVSFIERLMQRDLYEARNGYGTTVVKLVKNFRSHEAILKYPNERFYEGDLEKWGDKKITDSYLGSSYLPNKKFPIVFHGICGKDDREASSPSFFNIGEALEVKRYVELLHTDRQFRTTANDIGIITPYNAQCRKIRTALKGAFDYVKVGSVEEFQGQERRVIIISTVRSSVEFVQYDLKHTLGFVANPRRFNVAVTRAQALLIIIGDPTVLGLDPLWRSFLNYVHKNNGWKGAPITWDPTQAVDEAGGYDRQVKEAARHDMNEFSRRMEALTLASVEHNEDDGNVDRPWREVE